MPKLKLDEAGNVAIKDGLPVWVLDDGSEETFDGPKLFATVKAVRKERDDKETEAKSAKELLRKFGANAEEIEQATEKLRLAKALDEKKLVEAGKIDEVVNERLRAATANWETEKTSASAKLSEVEGRLRKVLISNRVATSKVLKDYILTPDLVEALFGSNFDVEGDQVIPYRDSAKKERVYSATDPSKVADVDEALAILLKAHPNHDNWRKGTGASGSGATGAGVTRGDDFSSLPPEERLARALAGQTN